MSQALAMARADRGRHALHIDVLQGGERIGEELLDRRTVRVGRSSRNSLVLLDEHVPRSLALFHRTPDGYALRYTDAMHGEVARRPDERGRDLAALHAESARHGHGYDLALVEGAHGRVDVGDETLEFEVVPAPVLPPLDHLGARWLVAAASMALVAAALALGAALVWRVPSEVDAAAAKLWQVTRVPAAAPSLRAPAPASVPVVPAPSAPPRSRPRPPLRRAHWIAPEPVAPTGTPRLIGALPTVLVDRAPLLPDAPERTLASDYTPDGYLLPAVVARSIGERRDGVTEAYHAALRRDAALAGDVTARILVDERGRVAEVEILGDTLGAPEVRDELVATLRRWRAPLPTAGPARYEVPFRFRPTASF
jgi:TonB family protein